MNQQLNMFCANWIEKANQYSHRQLSDYFDKFISLYIVFNALYMEIMNEFALEGHPVTKDFRDKKAATDYVIQYLKSKYYINLLINDQDSQNHWQAICDIITSNKFNIILDWGIPQNHLDIELLNDLLSNSVNKKAKAILSILYYVRCNMFHGHKNFEQRQIELLVPLNYFLEKTIQILMGKLNQITGVTT